MLYFYPCSKLNDGKSSAYSEFCQALDKEVESCLLSDLKVSNCTYVCTYIPAYIHMYMCLHIQDVPGGMCQTLGGCSLC